MLCAKVCGLWWCGARPTASQTPSSRAAATPALSARPTSTTLGAPSPKPSWEVPPTPRISNTATFSATGVTSTTRRRGYSI